MKNVITKPPPKKTAPSLNELSNRAEMTEDRIRELEDTSIEFNPSRQETEIETRNRAEAPWENSRRANIYTLGAQDKRTPWK